LDEIFKIGCCYIKFFLVNCVWSDLKPISDCTKSCGGGTQFFTRSKIQEARNGGRECEGDKYLVQPCNEDSCKVNCEWGAWGTYSKCSKSCGGGTKSRSRSKSVVESNGGSCSGFPTETKNCNTQGCPRQYSSIMVVGGYGDGTYHKDTQIMDLSKQKTCKWNDFPTLHDGATGAIMPNNEILICGGISKSSSGYTYHDECYKLSIESKSWSYVATMSSKRKLAASAEIDGKLFITGGYDGNDRLSTTEFITVEGEVSAGPNLPSPPRSSHCMMKLPSGKIIITGGYPGSSVGKKVLEFDPATNSYVDMPPLTTIRYKHACAVFQSPQHEDRYVALAAGGEYEATAEILDYTQPNAKWTPIASLPTDHVNARWKFWGARAVTSPSGQGAIVQYGAYLYELECDIPQCKWKILPTTLQESVEKATVIALPPGVGC